MVVVDLVGHGKEGGVLLDPVLHRVDQVLVRLHHVFFKNLERVICWTNLLNRQKSAVAIIVHPP